jgi:hypothetical protein
LKKNLKKNFAENLAVLTRNTEKMIKTLVFKKKPIFLPKIRKIAQNCYHNIEPRYFWYCFINVPTNLTKQNNFSEILIEVVFNINYVADGSHTCENTKSNVGMAQRSSHPLQDRETIGSNPFGVWLRCCCLWLLLFIFHDLKKSKISVFLLQGTKNI